MREIYNSAHERHCSGLEIPGRLPLSPFPTRERTRIHPHAPSGFRFGISSAVLH